MNGNHRPTRIEVGRLPGVDRLRQTQMRILIRLLLALVMAQTVVLDEVIAAPIPESVVKLAGAYAAAHPDEKLSSERSVLDEYAIGFFLGFTRADESLRRSGIRGESYARGASRWRSGQERREQTFAEFGYVRVELCGVFSVGYESSNFTPDGQLSGYWLNGLPDYQSDVPRNGGPGIKTYRAHVIGFLSPSGRYGHLGYSRQELLAHSVKLVDGCPGVRGGAP